LAHRENEQQVIRAEALRQHARMKGGKPVMCSPPAWATQARVNGGLWEQKVKVIFKSIEDAEAFAKIVYGLDGSVQVAYVCEYSRHGHAHLATDRRAGPVFTAAPVLDGRPKPEQR